MLDDIVKDEDITLQHLQTLETTIQTTSFGFILDFLLDSHTFFYMRETIKP